ncbi:MAG: FtsX-like permease family protein [Candidatus Latescibacteria bacterium]|nr:FtsX-like permease family protein [Candidatus Latescibacterota bacterium]
MNIAPPNLGRASYPNPGNSSGQGARLIGILLQLLIGLLLAAPGRGQVESLRATIEALADVDSRLTGYPGARLAAERVQWELEAAGITDVRRDSFEVVVPIDKGGHLRLEDSGAEFPLWGLWPNLVQTPSLPPEGIRAGLVYGGRGEWEHFDGQAMDGRVVLLEFDSWNHWLRAASLGARAVIFIEPEGTNRHQAEAKYAQVPLDLPRFWVPRQAGLELRRRLHSGELAVQLQGRMSWEKRPAWNIWCIVPGIDPQLARERVAIQAYYDGTSVVPALAPSAETACSIAALLELARHFKTQPPGRTTILVATSAHFQNRQGMADFLNRHARRHPRFAGAMEAPLGIDLFIGLDLSSRTDQIGLWNNTARPELRRFFAPFGRNFGHYAQDLHSESGPAVGSLVNGITPIKGLGWSTYMPGGIAADSELALEAGLISLGLITINDGRLQIDSPLDRAAAVDYDHLARQVALLKGVLKRALDDPQLLVDKADFAPVLPDRLRDLRLKVRTFPRRSQTPDRPVADAVAVLRPQQRGPSGKTIKGVRRAQVHLSGAQGELSITGLPQGQYRTGVYVLDPASGAIAYATDLSKRAQGFHGAPLADGSVSSTVQWARTEQSVVVFPCLPSPFYGLVNPRSLNFLGGITLFNSYDAQPRQFGYALGSGLDEAAGVVFGPPGNEPQNQIKILVGQQLLLLNNGLPGSRPSGEGFALKRDRLVPTLLQATWDMWRLDEDRLQTMRDHAIENQQLQQLHQRTAQALEAAETALQQHQWSRYVAHIRVALGLENQVYPQAMATLNDVIKGIVFFLALLIPAAFLGERLLLGAARITHQLAGFGVLLALVWLAISQVHPAFSIAHPLVILLAFAIMAMACFVLALIGSRFNTFMKERGDQVHHMEMRRFSVAHAAFMLGISNMRRRKLRTGLTLTTLVLLTFTVLSFASYDSRPRFISLPLEHSGGYQGILVRDRAWQPLGTPVLEYIHSHFASAGPISPRNWFVLQEDKKTYLEAAAGTTLVRTYGLLGLHPSETQVTGLDQALTAGHFFASDTEASCLLPRPMAAALGLEAADISRAQVQVMGQKLTVVGLVDTEAFNRIRDLDDGPLTPVDFELSRTNETTLPTDQATTAVTPSQYRPYVHMLPDNVLIAPYGIVRQLGGQLRSVAVSFDPDRLDQQAARALLEDFLLRVAVSLFVGLRETGSPTIDVWAYSSIGATAIKGLGALIIPMVIAALIVLNTMLGTVYERLKEIGIYAAVGLAPSHIALLFIAEACAYAVLGITLGYLGGQGLGLVLNQWNWLGGLNLNYSSLAAVFSALIVMAVVLLSTAYPARVAARTAVPDLTRRWQPAPPVGDEWEFRFPFLVAAADVKGLCGFLLDYLESYAEESLGSFYTEGALLQSFATPQGQAYALEARVWLAPLDLGVSQHVVLCAQPEGTTDIYSLVFYLRCLSGDNDSWHRANRGFLQVIRKELLIWNTLKAPQRAAFRQRAEAALI